MAFGWLLDRVWVDFGGQVGAKLALKSGYLGLSWLSWLPWLPFLSYLILSDLVLQNLR